MTTKNHDMPAFPGQYDHGMGQIESWTGMTLRDYFAAKALPAVIGDWQGGSLIIGLAQDAYAIADAMMEVREE